MRLVTVEVPFGKAEDGPKHVHVSFTKTFRPLGLVFVGVYRALQSERAVTQSGRQVWSRSDALRWIVQQIAEAYRRAPSGPGRIVLPHGEAGTIVPAMVQLGFQDGCERDRAAALAFGCLREGLRQQFARFADERPVWTYADCVRWVLERAGEGARNASR